MAQIIMIPKLNKDLVEVRSYRPISLLPHIIISKLFEKLLLGTNVYDSRKKANINHQFGFCSKYCMQQWNKSMELQTKLL